MATPAERVNGWYWITINMGGRKFPEPAEYRNGKWVDVPYDVVSVDRFMGTETPDVIKVPLKLGG